MTLPIPCAKAEGLVDGYAHDILHAGRRLRNSQIHATAMSVFNPAIAQGPGKVDVTVGDQRGSRVGHVA